MPSSRPVVLAPLAVLSVLVVLLGCAGRDARYAVPLGPVVSPSGLWSAEVVHGPPDRGASTWVPLIRDAAGREVFRAGTTYSTRQEVGVTWLSTTDQLWILSSSLGVSGVDRDDAGVWVESAYSADDVAALPPEIAGLMSYDLVDAGAQRPS